MHKPTERPIQTDGGGKVARVIKDISSEFGYYRLLESAEKAR